MDKPLKDPVQRMVLELTKHAMVKALDRHSYITFVHKKVYGYEKIGFLISWRNQPGKVLHRERWITA